MITLAELERNFPLCEAGICSSCGHLGLVRELSPNEIYQRRRWLCLDCFEDILAAVAALVSDDVEECEAAQRRFELRAWNSAEALPN